MAVRGSEVVFILARKGRCERASIDEVVSYKPPVISTFQFMTWEPKSNGCSKASISSHISLVPLLLYLFLKSKIRVLSLQNLQF
ncbi:hypothetical protein HanHA300_Chr09g0328921 [Helianthus annuus]|nr:hypothetical protein HanHA300_Chr09g0328921 [Helianthus annuus]KAJ0543357.1 hypothetical protein HanHA89_Chr09g0349811 [Helianthus annuus]KAJ0798672.1 hypothetical protein HanLR1_Chr00c2767g0856511 [Helianthus annuus]